MIQFHFALFLQAYARLLVLLLIGIVCSLPFQLLIGAVYYSTQRSN